MKKSFIILLMLCVVISVFAKEQTYVAPADANLTASDMAHRSAFTTTGDTSVTIERNRVVLFEQTLEADDWSYGVSDANSAGPYYVADNFYGVDAAITGFVITGLDLSNPWAACDEDPMTFDVNFYADNGGAMGDLLETRTATVNREALGIQVSGFDVFTWTGEFAAVEMTDGIVSFVGTSVGDPDGWFLWGNSPDGDAVNWSDDGTGWITNAAAFSDRCFTLTGADTPEAAPGAPTDFTVTPDAGGALTADLAWTNPALDFSGAPLTELDAILIYRDGTVVYTDDAPVIGAAANWMDTVPASGEYAYAVVGVNSVDEGSPASATVWVGEDVPAAVTGLLLEEVGGAAQLTWVNPTAGLHGGPFNNAVIGYHVVRSDGQTFEIAGETTMWTDTPPAGTWSYSVQPYNVTGDGGILVSNEEFIGEGSVFNVYIMCDDYGSETTWDVVDAGGTVLYSGGPYTALEEVDVNCPLGEGDYTFTIYDSWGDGICCDYGIGFYTLSVDGTVIFEGNGEFLTEEVTPFTIGTPAFGMVAGYVTDATRAPIEDAEVMINGASEMTDVDGYYMFDAVPVGSVDVYVEAVGYEADMALGEVVTEGNTTMVDFVLEMITITPEEPVGLAVTSTGVNEATATWMAPGAGGDLEEGFDGGVLPDGWMAVDNDNDGYNWEVSSNWEGYDGSLHCMTSASYDNDAGALLPDNWLISPSVMVGGGYNLTFWVGAQDPSWVSETYYVKVSNTTADVAAFTDVIHTETLTIADYHLVTLDLSAYAGQMIYLAWNHADCTDWFYLNLDSIAVMSGRETVLSMDFDNMTTSSSRGLSYRSDAPATRDLLGYNVYLDGVMLGYTTELEYVIDGLVHLDVYEIGVVAVWDEGDSDMTTVDYTHTDADDVVTGVTKLGGNYPNPFNPSTAIAYDVNELGNVKIEVFNVKGQKVKTLVDETKGAGTHSVTWNGLDDNGNDVTSGIYFYKMNAGTYTSTQKMMLIK